jgi:hypothetical protein
MAALALGPGGLEPWFILDNNAHPGLAFTVSLVGNININKFARMSLFFF